MIAIQGMNLEELGAEVAAQAARNHDKSYRARDCHFEDGHFLTPDGALPLTEEGGMLLADRCGVPRSVYCWLASNNKDEWSRIVSRQWDSWAVKTDKGILARLREVTDKEGATTTKVRAVLSQGYGVFDNTEFFQMFAEALPPEMRAARFVGMGNNIFVDPTSGALNCKLLIPTEFRTDISKGDRHSLGVAFGNNETGGGPAKFSGLFKRWHCTNEMRFAEADCRIVHQGRQGLMATGKIREALELLAGKADKNFASYWNTHDIRLADPADAMRNLQPLNDLGKRQTERIIETKLEHNIAESGYTAFSVVQSLTEYARDLEDKERAALVERAAGRLSSCDWRMWLPFLATA
jgi:hypothetical protein